MRVLGLLAALSFGCARAPLSLLVTPQQARVVQAPAYRLSKNNVLLARLENHGRSTIRVGAGELGNVHVESMVCDGKRMLPQLSTPDYDCCYAGSCTELYGEPVRTNTRALRPGEHLEFPLTLDDAVVEPDQLYQSREHVVAGPARCVVRFVYRPSRFVADGPVAHSNPVTLELASPPRFGRFAPGAK